MLPRMSFVVTALNEEMNIEATVREIHAGARGNTSDYELILVNDGSTDQTGAIMDRLAKTDSKVRVVHNVINLNLGGAFKRGLQESSMDYVMWLPGDNGAPSATISKVLSKVGMADIVIPYLEDPRNRSLFRRFVSRCYTMLLNTLFGLRIRYYNGGSVHRRTLIQSVDITTNSFACFAEATIKLLRRGCTYVEVGYLSTERTTGGGSSKAFHPRNVINVIKTIFRLYWCCVLNDRESRKPIVGTPNSAILSSKSIHE